MKVLIKVMVLSLATMLILSSLLIGCSSDGDETDEPTASPSPGTTQEPKEDVTLTIGMSTDKSGGGAAVLAIVDDGVEDAVEYYNQNNLIPGMKVKVISYDNEYDAAKEVPAYNYLKTKGADIIVGNMPNSVAVLKPFLNEDEQIFFGQSYTEEGYYPPGYMFNLNAKTDLVVQTMLEWIATNDPDFPQDRPARFGGVNWDEPLSRSIFEACKRYCEANPDRFKWEGHYLTGRVFTWDIQSEGLKDCDYLMPPMAGLTTFAKNYRDNGYTARFFGTDGHAAFMGLIEDANLWDELNGMYFALPVGYWTDDTELVNLAKQNVESRADTQKYYDAGTSYLGPFISYMGVLEIIAETAKEVGPENVDSQTLYETAQTFSMDLNGHEFAFSPTDRNAFDSFGVYHLSAEDKNLFRVSPDWVPVMED